jgi:hypothetical protein
MTAENLEALRGASWRLKADRVWRRPTAAVRPRSHDDELPDESFEPVAEGPRTLITFSADGARVELRREEGTFPAQTAPVVTGGRSSSQDGGEALLFELEGLFAGGRLVVRRQQQSFVAELRTYGSGLPIVSSERGRLERSALGALGVHPLRARPSG